MATKKNKIQQLLDRPNPDYDPSSAQATKRRTLMQENPVLDIRRYLDTQRKPRKRSR